MVFIQEASFPSISLKSTSSNVKYIYSIFYFNILAILGKGWQVFVILTSKENELCLK